MTNTPWISAKQVFRTSRRRHDTRKTTRKALVVRSRTPTTSRSETHLTDDEKTTKNVEKLAKTLQKVARRQTRRSALYDVQARSEAWSDWNAETMPRDPGANSIFGGGGGRKIIFAWFVQIQWENWGLNFSAIWCVWNWILGRSKA